MCKGSPLRAVPICRVRGTDAMPGYSADFTVVSCINCGELLLATDLFRLPHHGSLEGGEFFCQRTTGI